MTKKKKERIIQIFVIIFILAMIGSTFASALFYL